VRALVDTSFLSAFYFPRVGSEQAIPKMEATRASPVVSSLVRDEFQQAVWFKVWLDSNGRASGVSQQTAQSVLAACDLDAARGVWQFVDADLDPLLARAERLVLSHTLRSGARAVDILHVAAALETGAEELLSFDRNQRQIVLADNLAVFP
jgi:predicted nucleic acid-binding protein